MERRHPNSDKLQSILGGAVHFGNTLFVLGKRGLCAALMSLQRHDRRRAQEDGLCRIEPRTGDLILAISDHLPWDEQGGEHLMTLQDKLTDYLTGIETEELM